MISILGALSIGVCGIFSVKLYSELRPDLEELLPLQARSVLDYKNISQRLSSTDKITLLILSEDTTGSKKFIQDFAAALGEYPKTIVDSVEFEIKKDLEFFENKKSLFIELKDLSDIKNFIEKKINYETELYNPLNIFRTTELPEPIYNFYSLKKKYDQQASEYTRFPDGYYATSDEKMRLIHINLPSTESKIESAYELRKAIDETLAKLPIENYAHDIKILFTGGAQELIEEHQSLLGDLLKTICIVIALVSLALFYYYKSFRGTLLLILSLLIGTLWTFTVTYFTIGYLNANSAFLGSIIIGNGINYGIIFLARYFEERKLNKNHARALYRSMSTTYLATIIASVSAGLSYGSLIFTEFRGFQQFGMIGLIGMILCWISAYLLLPAFLTLNNHIKPLVIRKSKKKNISIYGLLNAWSVKKLPITIILFSLFLTGLSFYSYREHKGTIIESDLTKLRDKNSMEKGAGAHYPLISKILPDYPHPLVILAHNPHEALLLAQQFREEKKDPLIAKYISKVTAIDDFVPENQLEKMNILKSIHELLTPRIREALSLEEKTLLDEFLTEEALTPFNKNQLPPYVTTKMTEKDGTLGNLILIEPPEIKTTQTAEGLIGFISITRSIADKISDHIPVAGQIAISADLIDAIKKDGPRATLFSLLSVVILVFITFRNIKSSFYVLLTLLLGVSWLFGCIYGFDIKINFLNFIALPITFGLSVDYGVNIYQRYIHDGKKNILATVQNTGPAVALASLTTIIGYGALLTAGNQAFVSFGLLSVIGEMTCLFTALFMLPAILFLTEKKNKK